MDARALHGAFHSVASLRGAQHALLGVLFAAMMIEAAYRLRRRLPGYERSEIASAFFSWSVMELGRFATLGARVAVFGACAAFAPNPTAPSGFTAGLAFVGVDLLYYLRHRLLHATRLGWALHEPHHASRRLNFLAAIRLGWIQRLIDDFFYLPLLLLGIDAITLLVVIEVNHAFQLWCHTDVIGPIPWLDPWLNTPSNHRVHHASDERLRDRNLGSTFMIWDRLLGTYEPEPADGVRSFGLGQDDRGDSTFAQQFEPLLDLARRWRRSVAARPTAKPSASTSGTANGLDA